MNNVIISHSKMSKDQVKNEFSWNHKILMIATE